VVVDLETLAEVGSVALAVAAAAAAVPAVIFNLR
jgi:hypothetical protein